METKEITDLIGEIYQADWKEEKVIDIAHTWALSREIAEYLSNKMTLEVMSEAMAYYSQNLNNEKAYNSKKITKLDKKVRALKKRSLKNEK